MSAWEKTKEVASNPVFQLMAAPLVGKAIDAGIGRVMQIQEAKNKAIAYKSMLAETPGLSRYPQKKLQRYFNTMYNANPSLAKDPLVSGNWVGTQVEQEHPGSFHQGVVKGVRDLAEIRKMTSGGKTEPGFFETNIKQVHSGIMHGQVAELRGEQQKLRKQERSLANKRQDIQQHASVLKEYERDLIQREDALNQKKASLLERLSK